MRQEMNIIWKYICSIEFLFLKNIHIWRGIFFNTLLRTPQHLKREVAIIKKDFNELNLKVILKML